MRVIKIKPNRGVSRLHIVNNTQKLRIALESDLKTKLVLSFVRIGGSNYVVWRNLDNGIIIMYCEERRKRRMDVEKKVLCCLYEKFNGDTDKIFKELLDRTSTITQEEMDKVDTSKYIVGWEKDFPEEAMKKGKFIVKRG